MAKTISEMQASQGALHTALKDFQQRLSQVEAALLAVKQSGDKASICEEYVAKECKEVAQLNEKVGDLDNRSRTNNIVIFGLNEVVDEKDVDLERRITREIFRDILDVQVKSVERLHRIGKKHN